MYAVGARIWDRTFDYIRSTNIGLSVAFRMAIYKRHDLVPESFANLHIFIAQATSYSPYRATDLLFTLKQGVKLISTMGHFTSK